MQEIVKKLTDLHKTISVMESCTGGALASSITDISGASGILKFSAVTYSNEYKIKMGVSEDIIKKYTVYSINVANEMSKNIANYANSNYGIGITGQLNKYDPNNITNENNVVYISIYDKDNDKFINDIIKVDKKTRKENKQIIVDRVIILLKNILDI